MAELADFCVCLLSDAQTFGFPLDTMIRTVVVVIGERTPNLAAIMASNSPSIVQQKLG